MGVVVQANDYTEFEEHFKIYGNQAPWGSSICVSKGEFLMTEISKDVEISKNVEYIRHKCCAEVPRHSITGESPSTDPWGAYIRVFKWIDHVNPGVSGYWYDDGDKIKVIDDHRVLGFLRVIEEQREHELRERVKYKAICKKLKDMRKVLRSVLEYEKDEE